MTYRFRTSQVQSVIPGDPTWLIRDGLAVVPRAAFQISTKCPAEYKLVIKECIDNGWLTPIAHVYDRELMWETLHD